MKNLYVKKYWEEENILIYLHFQDGLVTRQIEIAGTKKTYLTEKHPCVDGLVMADQPIDILEWSDEDIISKDEFELIWIK